jgi:hypothetical protein
MSAVLALRAVVLVALRDDAGLMALVNAVEDGSAVKVSAPAALLGAFVATEWGAKGVRGLSVRVPVTLIDRTDGTQRLSDAAARVDAVMDGLPATAGDWRIGTVLLNGARTLRSADGQWTMAIDYLVRLSRTD